jgi:predicted ester cyclase
MHDNAAILRRAAGHFSDPAGRERYFDLYAEHAVIHGYDGVEPGLPNIRRYYRALWEAFPDVRLTLDEVFSADQRLACRFTIEGTHEGPFRGLGATGRRIKYAGITILHFDNGKCVERWSQTDRVGLLRQLGVIQI